MPNKDDKATKYGVESRSGTTTSMAQRISYHSIIQASIAVLHLKKY
jgi:hypothetical protein